MLSDGLKRTVRRAGPPLLRVMSLPPGIVDITKTSDGMFLGQLAGDIGYNLFLGQPNPGPVGVSHSWRVFRAMSWPEKRNVCAYARIKGVDLRVFLRKGV